MAPITAYLWIFSMITLNYEIITVSSFALSIDGLAEYGLDLLIDHFLGEEEEEDNEPSLTDILSKLDGIEAAVQCSEKRMIRELGHMIKSVQVKQDFNGAVSYLHDTYESFKGLSSCNEKETLEDFAEVAFTLADTGVTARLNDIMDLISPKVPRTTPLFHLLLAPYLEHRITYLKFIEIREEHRKRSLENNSSMLQDGAAARCNEPLSAQQEIHKMYGRIIEYFIKGYTMKLYAYEILKKFHYGKFRREKEITKERYNEDILELTKSAVAAMKLAPRVIRSCDPEDENYIQLKWLFNGLLIPDQYLKSDTGTIHCDIDRGHIINVASYFPRQPTCDGSEIYNCTASSLNWVCTGKDSGRRYDEGGASAEDLEHCHPENVANNFVPEKRRHWSDTSCHMCFCLCDHKFKWESVRKFSLKLVQSRTSENKVITGLRFVEVNRCIYIQIQEGKIEPNGYIDEETVDWQKVEESSWAERWTVEWNRRTVDLFTDLAPNDYVMTGIGFDVNNDHLKLKVLYRGFEYSTGTLYEDEVDSDPDRYKRKRIEIEEPDIPTDAPSENIVTVGKRWSVDFRMTDKVKDLAQTAVPFLDSQEVISDPPRPLSGAGLYYKGQKGYGGFIGLKLIAYDYAQVLIGKHLSPREDMK